METDSGSIDISSIKKKALAPLEISGQGSDYSDSRARHVGPLQAIRPHADKAGNATSKSQLIEPESQRNTLPDLPSTVPDSQEFIHALNPIQPLQSQALQSITKVKNMSSESSGADGTQELSPSYYNGIISKSRSAIADAGTAEEDDEAQHTLNEGDEGHIDLTSSFVANEAQGEDLESELVDFSPTQPQPELSQFPESQRFKTPATVGRKRNYNGDLLESPELPRNPLLRDGAPTPSQVMGLSQVFAATQGASSPFINGLAMNPQSDRPSPNLDLNTRPATAVMSSPLRPISAFRRATTEPASKYVPMKHSQAERERRAKMNTVEAGLDGESDEEFQEEPSIVRRQRTRREREQKVKEQFQMASSPTRRAPRGVSSAIKSSPIRSPPTSSPDLLTRRRGLRAAEVDMPVALGVVENAHESEEETEQEDEDAVAVKGSGHLASTSDEDKENHEQPAIQIPQTTVKLQRVVDELASEIEASPSLRHTATIVARDGSITLHNSEPFAVANSQPSQPLATSQGRAQRSLPNLPSDGPEIVPHSQDEAQQSLFLSSPTRTHLLSKEKVLGGSAGKLIHSNSRQDGPKDVDSNTSRPTPDQVPAIVDLDNGIPETSAMDKSRSRATGAMPVSAAVETAPDTLSTTHFETAPSRLHEASISQADVEMSSPPIVTTPPGRKRKRMSEIAAQQSPHQSSLGFDAAEALQLDPDFVKILSQSPRRGGLRHAKRTKVPPSSSELSQNRTTTKSNSTKDQHAARSEEDEMAISETEQFNGHDLGEDPSVPQPVVMTPRADLRSTRRSTVAKDRMSMWELEASPPKHPTPIMPARGIVQSKPDAQHSNKKKTASSPSPPTVKATRHQTHPGPGGILNDSPDSLALQDNSVSDASPAGLGEVSAPNMVFACFNGKTRAYYPAKCLGVADGSSNRYQIQWDGYDPDEIDAYGVKSLDLRIGDLVKVDLPKFAKVSHVVRGFKDRVDHAQADACITDVRGHRTILVVPKQRKSLPIDVSTEAVREVAISAIYLDSNMWHQMKDRHYEYQPTSTNLPQLSGCMTPQERPSTPSTPSSRSRRQQAAQMVSASLSTNGIFTGMVFAISYEDSHRKSAVVDLIKANGGAMLHDSFMSLLQADKIELLPQFHDTGFAALLTDRHSRKEKYMQALALGLPCLSGRWIEASIREDGLVDWQAYLLPAGESNELEGATKSRILATIDPRQAKLADMMQSRSRPLDGASVVVVMGRGKAEIKRKPYLFLIQSLGAERIEKATDLKAAKGLVDQGGDIGWVFVDDRDVETATSILGGSKTKKRRSCKVAGNELVVQTLIFGRLCEV